MKKLFTFLLFSTVLFSFNSKAQTNCNALFTTQFLNSNTVKFNPAVVADTPSIHHVWDFGDGIISNLVSPTHSFANAGSYIVTHVLTMPTGLSCVSSSFISIAPPCNLTAAFSTQADPVTPDRKSVV